MTMLWTDPDPTESQPEPSAWTPGRRKRGVKTFKKLVTRYELFETEKPVQQLVRVKRKSPCPICNKPDWCSVAADGAFAICMRVQSNYESKNGGYVHVLDGAARGGSGRPHHLGQRLRAVTVEVKQYGRASIVRRNQVNQELLRVLKLRERDRANLLARGLNERAIERHGYRSVPSPSALDEVMRRFRDRDLGGIPGFFRKNGRWMLNIGEWRDREGITHSFHQGFLVPVRDVQGRIEGFQIRRAEVKPDEPRYIWLSSSRKEEGCSSGAPIHYRNPERARETGQAIITEGALKGDVVAHLLGGENAVIAVAGVLSFPEDFGRRLKWQLPELRQVVIAFDADADRKPEVQHGLRRLSESLRAAGLDVRKLKWAEAQGKGLDDYLLADPAHRTRMRKFLGRSLAASERRREGRRRQSPNLPDMPDMPETEETIQIELVFERIFGP